MTSTSAHPEDNGTTAGAGPSTDQHITGAQETGSFITDKAPTGDTPAHGSSNAGVNKEAANRTDVTED